MSKTPASSPESPSLPAPKKSDEDLLVEWIDAHSGCPNKDRTVSSYALEYLKTAHANAELAHKRIMAGIAIDAAYSHLKWLTDLLPRLTKTMEEIQALEKKEEKPK